MKKKLVLAAILYLAILPNIILAAPNIANSTLQDVVNLIISIFLNILWSVAVAYIIVMFVIAGFRFFQAHGEPGKVAEARQFFLWGLAGTVVIILSWSITAIVRYQLGL